jgi:hypothetical protein
VAVDAVDPKMQSVVVKDILPVTGITILTYPLIWIDFLIRIDHAGVGIVAGYAGKGEMFGIEKLIVLFVMFYEPIAGFNQGRIVSAVTLFTQLG